MKSDGRSTSTSKKKSLRSVKWTFKLIGEEQINLAHETEMTGNVVTFDGGNYEINIGPVHKPNEELVDVHRYGYIHIQSSGSNGGKSRNRNQIQNMIETYIPGLKLDIEYCKPFNRDTCLKSYLQNSWKIDGPLRSYAENTLIKYLQEVNNSGIPSIDRYRRQVIKDSGTAFYQKNKQLLYSIFREKELYSRA